MERYCNGCRGYHALEAFDLDDGAPREACRAHSAARTIKSPSRSSRQEAIEKIERRRRHHIAALVKLDAELADLRATKSEAFVRVDADVVFGDVDADLERDFGD